MLGINNTIIVVDDHGLLRPQKSPVTQTPS